MIRVLLVEDEPLVRMMAEEDLVDAGCDVTPAASGDEAALLIEQGAAFDALVTDIRMPGQVDGWELARRVRTALPNIVVVYVSGFAGDRHDPVDPSCFLSKPYRFEQLSQALGLSAG
jgi:CheY-like chemotaxis protein